MVHLAELLAGFAATASTSFVKAAVAGAVLSLLAAVALRLLPEIRPSNRFAIWGAVLAASVGLYVLPAVQQGTIQRTQLSDTGSIHLDQRWALLFVAIWAVVAIVRFARVIQSAIEMHGIYARSAAISAHPYVSLLRQRARRATLCSSNEIDRPCVVGFFAPKILLPEGLYESLTSSELEQIVMHEMEHLRRYDDWTNLLQKIALALFPLNPAIAWVEKRLCVERELACDDCVLQSATSRKQYATCLTNLAEFSILRRDLSLSLGAWSRRSELAQRVYRILHQPKYKLGRGVGYGITTVLAAGLFGGGTMLAKLPSFVSFSSPETSAPAISASIDAATAQHQFREAEASPVLVKAVMQQPRRDVVFTKRQKPRSAAKAKLRKAQPNPNNLMMRTDMSDQLALPRLVLAVDKTDGSSYAAVPVGNGWLVIQL